MIQYKRHVVHGVAWSSAEFTDGFLAGALVGQSGPRAFQDPERVPWDEHQRWALTDLIERKGRVESELHHAARVAQLKPICRDCSSSHHI